MKKLAKSERQAVHISNATNLVLFIAKVYASMESRSMAVIASTLDSLLDLLSGFILWFTANAMRKPNHYSLSYWQTTYATCGMLVCPVALYLVSVYQTAIHMNSTEEQWMIGIMASVTRVKFLLMLYCRGFQNVIVRAYAQDHLFDVVDIVLPEDMRLQEAHNIGETQEMLEQLVEVERAFVHVDFEFTHLPEHKY
ncbi:metal tolerance protein 10-like [Brassica napus]|uniref:metal tolerance protein 10-like n=1 Tax=Brassica napus TaxID=3708 RepID=UPI00207A6E1B|nr:metal tolerance protein 10-like [Brassica napus]